MIRLIVETGNNISAEQIAYDDHERIEVGGKATTVLRITCSEKPGDDQEQFAE
jgi:hypothetical protein